MERLEELKLLIPSFRAEIQYEVRNQGERSLYTIKGVSKLQDDLVKLRVLLIEENDLKTRRIKD